MSCFCVIYPTYILIFTLLISRAPNFICPRSYEQSVDGLGTDLLLSAIGFSVGSLASYVFMNYTVYRNPFGLDPIMRTSAAIVVGMLGFVAIYVPRRTARMLRSFADELRRAQNVGEDDIDNDFYYYYTRHSTPYLALEDKVGE